MNLETYIHAYSDVSKYSDLSELHYESSKLDDSYMLSSPERGMLLYLLCKSLGAKRIMDLGTYTGHSALWLSKAIYSIGYVWSIDTNPHPLAKKYCDGIPNLHLKVGDVTDALSTVECNKLDFVYLDTWKLDYVKHWKALVPKVRPGGFILADDTLWMGDPENSELDEFNKFVAEDARVEQLMLPLDNGLTLARKL